MAPLKNLICVSTTAPSTSLTPSGGGGSLALLCPKTGSILSSLRTSGDLPGRTSLGMSSVSPFPQAFSKSNTHLVMAYGRNSTKRADTYGLLLSLRSGSSSPILHWKCRLPEADLTGGLLVSKCGHYVVGGGVSGSCFVWSTIGGRLLKTFKAHYRACTCLAWSDCGRYLVSGGADGMVHVFPLMDLVDLATRNSKRSITPLHTWSSHHFPITCLATLDSGRMASAAEDGQIAVMELFSKQTLATLKVPSGISCMTHHGGRLYAGTTSGTIFSIDLNAYAMYQTEKHGASLAKRQKLDKQKQLALAEKVLGKAVSDENAALRTFQSEWIGHDSSVTSIAFLEEDAQELLVSGDELGQVRLWDVESRTGIHVVQPWSHGGTSTAPKPKDSKTSSSTTVAKHPVSSITVVPQPAESASSGMFPSGNTGKGQPAVASLVTPLQKFWQDDSEDGHAPFPFLKPDRSDANLQFWEPRTLERKRKGRFLQKPGGSSFNPDGRSDLNEAQDVIAELEQKLQAKQREVERWEKVNNKLMAKLKPQL